MRKVLKCWRQVHSTQIFRGRKSGFHKQSIYLFGIVVSEKMMKMEEMEFKRDSYFKETTQKQQTSNNSSAIFCSNCGEENNAGAKFCCGCGKELTVKKFCSNCGAFINNGSKFCQNCGEKV